jgi:hypothetical protein
LLRQGDGFIQKRLIFNNFYAFSPLSQESLRFYPAGAVLSNQNYLSHGALESFNRLRFCQLLRQSQKRLVFDPLNFPAPSSHQSLSVNPPRLLDSDGLRLLDRESKRPYLTETRDRTRHLQPQQIFKLHLQIFNLNLSLLVQRATRSNLASSPPPFQQAKNVLPQRC